MINFYHPNSKNLGYACSLNYDSKNNTVFAQIIRQSSWDEQNKIGSFKGNSNNENKISIKLGNQEVAGILDAIDKGIDFSTYHQSQKQDEQIAKSIGFKKWFSKTEPNKQTGYSFSVTLEDRTDKTKNESFYIGLKFSEARLVREYLIWCLNQIFAKEASDFDNKNENI